ncbi:CHAP domain-containing protein [Pseudarthrobacter oxydans]|uniref:CHAP domain-containing protein n=1 Tax=Pseudarthrobacter oxydans TaxID=1671 RepID=UPI003ECFCA54
MSDIREDWAVTTVGQALNPDRFAGNQCVDVTDHFGECIFGVPWQQCVGGVRGAKDLLDRAPDEYWTRIDYYHGFIPERFDVLVYAGDDLNEWGHTAVVESADKIGINVIQQDGFAAPHQFVDGNWYSAKPAHRARLAYSARGTGRLLGVLRARPEKLRAGGTIQLQSASTITPITPIQEVEVSAEEVFNKKLTLKNGAESTFENQVLNISDDLSKVLKRQEEDRNYAQAVNGKLDGIINLIAALPTEVLRQKITTVDGRETTLETEVKWLPTNFQAVQSGGKA